MADRLSLRRTLQSGGTLRGIPRSFSRPQHGATKPPTSQNVTSSPSALMKSALKFVGGRSYTPEAMKKYLMTVKKNVQHGHTEGLTKQEIAAAKKVTYGGAMEKKTQQTIAAAAIQMGRHLQQEHRLGRLAAGVGIRRDTEAAKFVLKEISKPTEVNPPKPEPAPRLTLDQLRQRIGIQQGAIGGSAPPAPAHPASTHAAAPLNFINPVPLANTAGGSKPATPIFGGRTAAGQRPTASPLTAPVPPTGPTTDHDATNNPVDQNQAPATTPDDSTKPADVSLPDTSHLSDPFVGE